MSVRIESGELKYSPTDHHKRFTGQVDKLKRVDDLADYGNCSVEECQGIPVFRSFVSFEETHIGKTHIDLCFSCADTVTERDIE